jgi:metal-responsive CopG/Arc/MetJ family transcriptional regulator
MNFQRLGRATMNNLRFQVRDTEEELKKLDEAIRILGYKDRADWYRDMKRKAIAESKRKEATPCKTD